MTGTPEGVAPMEIGSTVSVEVKGIGVLTNSVVPSLLIRNGLGYK